MALPESMTQRRQKAGNGLRLCDERMLGHSTVAITLDTYSHVTPAMHREAARVMDHLFGQ
jgi:integrase